VNFAASIGTDLLRAVLQGAPPGTVYALVALGFVLAYKTSGVFNLAFGAQAYASAVVYFKTHTEWEWGIVPSLLVSVVILAPLIGFALEWLIFRHLRTAPAVSKLVVALGVAVALPAIVDLVTDFKTVTGRTPEGIVADGNSVFYDPFGVYAFSRNELVAMGVALVAMAALAALFRFSAVGLRMRAVVESPRMTELNGIAADRVSAFAWALSSFFAGLAGVLIAPRFNTLAPEEFFNIVVVAVAAAAVGRLVSLPGALAGGLGLGILIALFNTFIPRWSDDWTWLAPIQENLTPAIPFLVLFGVLVFVPSLRRRAEAGDPLSGVDPPPVSQARVERDPRRALVTWLGGAAALVAVAWVLLSEGSTVWIFLVTQAVVLAIVFLSITVITGIGGYISLAQGAFAAMGGFAVYQLAELRGYPSLSAAVVGGVIAAAAGAVLALPIRRLNGIWVAIATLAFAFFFDAVMVKFSWIGGSSQAATVVPRPVIGPWDFASDESFLALAVVLLAAVATGVSLFARSTTGRTLRAVRGSEVAAQSIGISPVRSRVVVFAVSAFVAGLGGALLAIHQENVNYANNFTPFGSLFWLVLVVTFGVRSPAGAIAAAATFALFDRLVLQGTVFEWILRSADRVPDLFPLAPSWLYILFGLGAIQYARHPEGVIDHTRKRQQDRRARRAAERATVADAAPDTGRPAPPPTAEMEESLS